MTRMVSHSLFYASLNALTIEFLAGNQLEQSMIHLMPSLEVSQIMMYGCTHSHSMIIERPA